MRTSSRIWGAVAVGLTVVVVYTLHTVTGQVPRAVEGRGSISLEAQRNERPNIVVVLADDMRVDDLRFMPHAKRMIGRPGVTFRNSFSPYPLCCPSRASFLTGQYPHNHGVLLNVPPGGFGALDDSRTVATSLHAAGYLTAFVGKYLNGYGAARSLVTGGPSRHYVPPGWTDWYGALEFSPRSGERGGVFNYFDTIFNVNGRLDDNHHGQYQTAVLGRFARRIVRTYSTSPQPFFLWLSALAPHGGSPREHDDPARVRSMTGGLLRLASPARPSWVKGRFDRRLRHAPGLPDRGGSPEGAMADKPPFLRSPPISRSEEAAIVELARQRAESLHILDLQIGRLVTTLERTGTLRDTVIIFTSDNGYFLGEHRLRFAKSLPYEPALRVPLLIAGPGVPAAERFDPVTPADITASILDLGDAPAPRPADGRSLLPWSARRGWPSPVVTEAVVTVPRHQPRWGDDARTVIGIRTARYAFNRWVTGDDELYDLRKDPNELVNVVRDTRYRGVRHQLLAAWATHKDCRGASCWAPLPTSLRVAPARLAELTEHQADRVRARFGTSW